MPRIVATTTRPRRSRRKLKLDLTKVWGLSTKQEVFAFSTALFSLFLGGVGSGKSHALTAWVVTRALYNPGSIGALLGRSSGDLETVLVPALLKRFDELQAKTGVSWIKDYDRENAKLTLRNGTVIYLRPYNRIAKLRGLTLTWCAADEVEWSEADPDEVWSVLTGRLRGPGPVPGLAFATSPNGLRGITKKFVDAQRQFLQARSAGDQDAADRFAQYHVVTATSFDNPHNPPHFYDSLRSMSARRYKQEVEGKVLQPLHTVYQLETRHLTSWNWREHPELPRVYGVDWGTNDHHVALMFQVLANGQWVLADELVCDEMPRGKFQDALHRWIDSHGRDAPVLIAVDRAVPVENQKLAARYRTTSVRWMEGRDEQDVTTGIEFVHDLMDPLEGDPQLLFAKSLSHQSNGTTAGIIPALRGYQYFMGPDGIPTTRPRKDNQTDHACDALRYACLAGSQMPQLHGGRKVVSNNRQYRAAESTKVGNSGRQVA